MRSLVLAATILTVTTLSAGAPVQAATTADLGTKAKVAAVNPAEFDKRMAQIQEHMKQMQVHMDKIRQTQNPQER